MTILPAGAGPPVRLATPTEVVVCALDPKLVGAVGSEVEGRAPPELAFIGSIHDRDLLDLLRILGREVDYATPASGA